MPFTSWIKRKLFTIPGEKSSEMVDVKFNEFLMKPVGLSVAMLYGNKEETLSYKAGVAWAWFCAGYLILTLFSEAEELRRSGGDLDRVTVNACVMLIVAMGVCKVLGVLLPRRRLALLLHRLRHGFPPTHTDAQLQVLRDAAVHVRVITLVFGVMSLCLICMWNSLPLLQSWLHLRRARAAAHAAATSTIPLNVSDTISPPKFERQFPMIAWYPWDWENNLALYIVTYSTQNFCAFVYGCVHIGVDTFYLSYIIYVSAHLKVLSMRFRDMREHARHRLSGGEDEVNTAEFMEYSNEKVRPIKETYYSEEDLDAETIKIFGENVRYHQDIIEFVRDLETLISPVMLVQFFISAIVICLSGFQATVTVADFTLVLKYMVYLATAAFQLSLYCWYGQILINESLGVHRAVYEAEWPDAGQQLKRALRIVMMRAQRPVSLASAKIYVLSLDTFVKVLNTSYSFFAVLRQINEPHSVGGAHRTN